MLNYYAHMSERIITGSKLGIDSSNILMVALRSVLLFDHNLPLKICQTFFYRSKCIEALCFVFFSPRRHLRSVLLLSNFLKYLEKQGAQA